MEEIGLVLRSVLRYAAWTVLVASVAAAGLAAGVYLSVANGGAVAVGGHSFRMPWSGPPPFGGRDTFTVLVLGLDEKARGNQHSPQRSDSIMLLQVDLKTPSVKGVSIPRDTLTTIPGREHQDKINAAYALGFAPLSIETVKALTGVSPDYYLVSDVGGFQKMVDLIGGVEIDVEKDMNYDDNWQNLHIHLRHGYRHLNGYQAMGYVRFRHDRLGDVARMQRQQKFLKAVVRRAFAMSNLPKLPEIVREARKAVVDTNMTTADLLYMAQRLKGLNDSQILLETLPGVPQNIHGVSYWVLDDEKAHEVISKVFGTADVPTAATVEVLNGTGRRGLARQVAQVLAESGFKVVRVANDRDGVHDTSTVLFRPESQEGAMAIANLLGTSDVQSASDGRKKLPGDTDITVIVGSDYRQENAL